ncbi:MAG: tetratricopeptide repeat protein, partial [Candidatus Omnitrophica bacterium]|nr:tetratricopeptide repeat protein [Candidatus Omnitrophota bacterium]
AIGWIIQLKKVTLIKMLLNFSFFILGLFMVIGSVTLRNYLVEKDFVLIAGNIGINFYSGNNPRATGTFFCPAEITLNQEDMFRDSGIIARYETGKDLKTSGVSNFWFNKAIEFIRKDRVGYLKLLLKKITYCLSQYEFIHDIEYQLIAGKIGILKIMFKDLSFLLPFGILGMLIGLRRFKDSALLYIFLFAVSSSIVMFFVAARYRLVIVPVIMIFVAFGFFSLLDALKNKSYIKFYLLILTLVAIFILLNFNSSRVRSFAADLKDNSGALDYHLAKAMVYEDNSDYPNAIKELILARTMHPENRRAIFRLGVIRYFLGDFRSSEEEFKEVTKISPLCFDAYYNLGLIYNLQGRFKEAEAVLDRAVFLYPEDASVHFELGMASKFIGNVKKAKREFGLALEKINRWRIEEKAIIEKELADISK